MWFGESRGVPHLESPWAASVPDLRPIQGRVRNVVGNSDESADEGAACRLNRRHCTQVNLTYERQRKQKEDL